MSSTTTKTHSGSNGAYYGSHAGVSFRVWSDGGTQSLRSGKTHNFDREWFYCVDGEKAFGGCDTKKQAVSNACRRIETLVSIH